MDNVKGTGSQPRRASGIRDLRHGGENEAVRKAMITDDQGIEEPPTE